LTGLPNKPTFSFVGKETASKPSAGFDKRKYRTKMTKPRPVVFLYSGYIFAALFTYLLFMKKTIVALVCFTGLVLLAFPFGCYYDNEEDLYGPPLTNCDTAGMRFSVEIREIMAQNCNECHLSSSSTYSGFTFETHADVEAVAKNGKLLNRINSQSLPMPPTGLLSECHRAKIEAWVKAGAPNN